jgi:hypothetical protein
MHTFLAATHTSHTTGELLFAAGCIAAIMLIAGAVLWYTIHTRRGL